MDPVMHLLNVRLFGEFSATDQRGNAIPLTNKRAQALLIYLAIRVGQDVTLSEVGQLLFAPNEPEENVRQLVNELLYALRFAGPSTIVETRTGIRLNEDVVSIDVQRFALLYEDESLTHIREAADLYRGNLLGGFLTGIAAFDDWVAAQRVAWWRAAVSVLGRLLLAQIKAGWWENAVETAGRLLSLDPSQEVVHRTLMRLQLEQGRPDAALRRYQECAEILRREFNRTPSPETERLRDDIMAILDRTPAPREAVRKPSDRPVLVLVVEDDLVSSALVEGFLSEAGYEVVAVADGADALLELGRREFDLLVLDINIPTLSGLRLFEIMIQKGMDTPAIFMTGIPGAEVETRSLEAGAADFLRKPIRKEALLPRVRTILQRRQRERAQR
jgi:DNA-binding SARP family transcriptional activator